LEKRIRLEVRRGEQETKDVGEEGRVLPPPLHVFTYRYGF